MFSNCQLEEVPVGLKVFLKKEEKSVTLVEYAGASNSYDDCGNLIAKSRPTGNYLFKVLYSKNKIKLFKKIKKVSNHYEKSNRNF